MGKRNDLELFLLSVQTLFGRDQTRVRQSS